MANMLKMPLANPKILGYTPLIWKGVAFPPKRGIASGLRDVLAAQVPAINSRVGKFRAKYGKTKISEVTVDKLYGGLRGVDGLMCDTSVVDAAEGIRFRGYTIADLQQKLPRASENGMQPLPEGVFWLLLTGNIPSEEQVRKLSLEWGERAALPQHVVTLLNNMPSTLHPMSQLISAVAAMNLDSKFAKAYAQGVPKQEYWQYYYEDVMDLIAKLPVVAATIFCNTYCCGTGTKTIDTSRDWSANFVDMMGFSEQKGFTELMRLYLTIHSDHEGGNVSAHATHLVGSALSDPYLALAAGYAGLAGRLHGLANQEVVQWLNQIVKDLGENPDKAALEKYCLQKLQSGQVIPGYGHAVLRITDPRYTAQRDFALQHCPDDKMVLLVAKLYEVVPPLLTQLGKVQNPWPNVDAHSGVLLMHYGMDKTNFFTVLFAVSRALGVLANLILSRAQMFPIERPKSLSYDLLLQKCLDISDKDPAYNPAEELIKSPAAAEIKNAAVLAAVGNVKKTEDPGTSSAAAN